MTSDVNSKVNSYYKHMQKHFQSHGRTKEFVGHSSKVFISFAEVYFTNWTIIIFLVHFLVVKITTYFIFQDIIDIIDFAKVPNYEYNDKKKEILFRNIITSVADVIQSIV